MSNNAHSLQVELQQSIDEAFEFVGSMQRKYDAARGSENEDYYANKLTMAKYNLKTLEEKLVALKAEQNNTIQESTSANAQTKDDHAAKVCDSAAQKTSTSQEQESKDVLDSEIESDLLLDAQRDQEQSISPILHEANAKSHSNSSNSLSDADNSTAATQRSSLDNFNETAAALDGGSEAASNEAAAKEPAANEAVANEVAAGAHATKAEAAADEHARGHKARAKSVKAHSGRKDLSQTRIVGDSVYLQDKKSAHTQMRIQLRNTIAKVIEGSTQRLPDWFTLSCRIASLFKTMSVQEIEYTARTMLSAAWRRKSSSVGVKTAAMRKCFAQDLICNVDSHRLAIRASESVMSKERSKLFVRCKKAIESGKASSIEAFNAMCHEFSTDFIHLTEREIVLRCRLQWYQQLVDFAKINVDRKSVQVEYNKRIFKEGIETKPTADEFVFTSGNTDQENKAIERGLEKYQKAVREYIQAAKFHFVPTADEVFEACKQVAPVVSDSEKHYICEVMCNRFESQVLQMRNKSFTVNDKISLRNAIKRLALLTEEKNAIAKTLQSFLSRLNTVISSMKAAAKDGLMLGTVNTMQLSPALASVAIDDNHLESLADTERIEQLTADASIIDDPQSTQDHDHNTADIDFALPSQSHEGQSAVDQLNLASQDIPDGTGESQARQAGLKSTGESQARQAALGSTGESQSSQAALGSSGEGQAGLGSTGESPASQEYPEGSSDSQVGSGESQESDRGSSAAQDSCSVESESAREDSSSNVPTSERCDCSENDSESEEMSAQNTENELEDAPLFRQSDPTDMEAGHEQCVTNEGNTAAQRSLAMNSNERAQLHDLKEQQAMPAANVAAQLGSNSFVGTNVAFVPAAHGQVNMPRDNRAHLAQVPLEHVRETKSVVAKVASEGEQISLSAGDRMVMGASYRRRNAGEQQNRSHSNFSVPPQMQQALSELYAKELGNQMQNQNAQPSASFDRVEDVFSSEDGCNIDTRSILHREAKIAIDNNSQRSIAAPSQVSAGNYNPQNAGYSQRVGGSTTLVNNQAHSSIFANHGMSQGNNRAPVQGGSMVFGQNNSSSFEHNETVQNQPRSMFGRFNPFHR